MVEKISGLRANYTFNRVETAQAIARGVLTRAELAGHEMREPVYGKESTEISGLPRVVVPRSSDDRHAIVFGAFEIHRGGQRVALVKLTDFGKPMIYIRKGSESLGKALSTAFKEHAEYFFSPRVTSHKEPPSSEDLFHPEDLALAERDRLRMK